MKIEIIGSGSLGNCIKFCDKILLDLGLPFKEINGHIEGIKAVLLTHRHGDHFNKTTIRKLHIGNESIKFCAGEFLTGDLLNMGLPKKNIITIEAGKKYKIDDITFSPFKLHHDIPNFGYRIMQNEHRHITATDTFSMDGITAHNYDSCTLEANHDLNSALNIIEKKRNDGEFCHLSRAINTHLNVDKAIEFVTENNIKQWIPVHIGSLTKQQVMEKLSNIDCVSLI